MFIKSQEGQKEQLIVNTDNVAAIFCTDDNEIKVLYNFYNGADPLGQYENADETKAAMEYIANCLDSYNANMIFEMPSIKDVKTKNE